MVHKYRLPIAIAIALATAVLLAAQVAGYARYPLVADWQPSPPVCVGAMLLAFGAGLLTGRRRSRSIAADGR